MRLIHFNNEVIADKFGHLVASLWFVSFYICTHDLMDNNTSYRIVIMDVIIIMQFVAKRESLKYITEKEVLTGQKPFLTKYIPPNRTCLEYVFGFKTQRTVEIERELFASLKRLSKIRIPDTVATRMRYKDIDEKRILGDYEQCPICFCSYEPSSNVILVDQCSHLFHKHCLKKWYRKKRTCPIDGGELKETQ